MLPRHVLVWLPVGAALLLTALGAAAVAVGSAALEAEPMVALVMAALVGGFATSLVFSLVSWELRVRPGKARSGYVGLHLLAGVASVRIGILIGQLIAGG